MESCANSDLLVKFLVGELPDKELREIAEHVETCVVCQATLESVSDDPELRSWAQHAISLQPAVSNLQGVVQKIIGDPVSGIKLTKELRLGEHAAGFEPLEATSGEDRYELIRVFAEGGLGRIWLAYDKSLGRNVALKELLPRRAENADARRRFLREAQIAGRLEHPNIVPVYEFGRESKNGQPFYAMRRVVGQTLGEVIAECHSKTRRAAIDLQRLLNHFLSVCNAISYAHSRGVIHRDLKPENVLVGKHGEVIVLDWGLAKSGVENEGTDTGKSGAPEFLERDDLAKTQDGSILGTPAYMSPEQAEGKTDRITTSTDIYGLGAILFELLTGKPPHRGPDAKALLTQITDGTMPGARLVDHSVSAALDAICRKAMAKEPVDRYRSVRDLIDDVQRYVADEPISVHREGVMDRLARWFRQHRTATVAGSISLASIALTAIVALFVTAKALDRERIANQSATNAASRERAANERNETTLQREGITSTVRNLKARDYETAARSLALVPASRRGWECLRLKHEIELAPQRVGTLAGEVDQHEWRILSSLLSSDGRTLATSSLDGRLIVWNIANLEESNLGPTPSFELVAGSWSETHNVWRSSSFPLRADDEQAGDAVVKLAWVEDGKRIAGACLSGRALIWDLQRPQEPEVEAFKHDQQLSAVAATADGSELLFGDEQGVLIRARFEQQHWTHTTVAQLDKSPIMDIVRVAAGFWIVGQGNGDVTILRSSSQNPVKISIPQPAWDLDFAPELNLLAIACGDGAVRTFDVASDGQLDARTLYRLSTRTESGPPRPIHTVHLAISRNQVLAGDDSGRLIIWDLEDPSPTPIFIRGDQLPGRVSAARRNKLPQFLRRSFSAIHVSPDGNTALTTGRNTCVNHWDISARRGITEFSVGSRPIVAFDREDAELMWVARKDGELSLWDSRATAKVASQLVEGSRLNGLAMAADSRVVATCSDRSIQFWSRSGHDIRATREPLRHKLPLRNIALSPDGNRVAGYDQEDNVVLWDVRTGESKTVSMAAEDGESAVAGVVAFNADGTTLAAAGPGQSLWILDAASLKLINKPYLVAGGGGTALAWHPTDRQILYAGDTLGRLFGRHLLGTRELVGAPASASGIVGLAFSPAGDRVVTVDQLGAIQIVDPIWIGKVLKLQSSHATSENRPTSLALDPTGSRLALAHADGTVQIWETSSPSHGPDMERGEPAMTRRVWNSTTIVEGREAARIHIREPSVALDEQNQLSILYAAVPEETRQVVRIAQESPRGTRIQTLEEIDLTRVRSLADVHSSLALLFSGSRLWATLRRPRPDESSVSGQIIGYHRQLAGGLDSSWNEESISNEPDNSGFHVHLFEGPNGKPAAAHFSWDGYHLYGTYWTGREWRHERVGRQGDGNELHAAQGPDGTIHTLFKPMRFGADPSPSVYLAFRFPRQRDASCLVVHREVFDRRGESGRIAVLPDGTLIVESGGELVSRSDSGWTTVLERQQTTGRLAYDPTSNRYFFAGTDPTGRQILLTSVKDGQAITEQVWKIPADQEPHPRLITRVDSRGLPLVVACSHAEEQGWLRVFRTDESLATTGSADSD